MTSPRSKPSVWFAAALVWLASAVHAQAQPEQTRHHQGRLRQTAFLLAAAAVLARQPDRHHGHRQFQPRRRHPRSTQDYL